MATKTLVLPRLTVGWETNPTYVTRAWNEAMTAIEKLLNQITAIPEIQTALGQLDTAIAQAQTAADAANTAASNVNAASSLASSYVNPSNVLTASSDATTGTITIADHTRVYGDGTSVMVKGGSVTGLGLSSLYYVYYNDALRVGGTVVYRTTTDATTAAQTGSTHTVGSITTPAASGSATGVVVRPPGVGSLP